MEIKIPQTPAGDEPVNTLTFQVRLEHDPQEIGWDPIVGASSAHEAAEIFVASRAQVDPAVLHGVVVRVKGIGLFRVVGHVTATREPE